LRIIGRSGGFLFSETITAFITKKAVWFAGVPTSGTLKFEFRSTLFAKSGAFPIVKLTL
jgi:hypothetical protein